MDRRNFIKLSSAAAFGGLIFGAGISGFGQKRDNFPLPETVFAESSSTFSRQTFEPLINTSFDFADGDNPKVSMKLVEVVTKENAKNYPSHIPTDGFVLIFEVQEKTVLEDRIYQVSHSALNDFPMSVSTVGRSGRRYQAVYNRVYF